MVARQSLQDLQLGQVVLDNKIGVIAGGGQLPYAVARQIHALGKQVFVLALQGEADKSLRDFPCEEISITDLQKLIQLFKREKIKQVVLAGGVRRRPSLRELSWNRKTISALFRFVSALRSGDDALLRAFMGYLENYGFEIISAHQIVPQFLTPLHPFLTQRRPSKQQINEIMEAAKIAKLLGEMDIGQAVVSVGGRVVALEGAEGTDNMLQRVAELRRQGRIDAKGGFLLKAAKPQQDFRADLPAIGPVTVENVFKSHLDGIAVEAEKSFILEFEKTINLANNHKVFITSFCQKKLEKKNE